MRQSRPLHQAFTHAPANGHVGVIPPGRPHWARHHGGRLQAQDQFLPLLVVATLLTTLTLVVIAYVTVRADVLASQQQQVSRDARIAEQMLAGPGAGFALKDGQLVALLASGQGTAPALAAQLPRVRDLTGDRLALYTMQARGLVIVASAGLGTVGQPADAAVAATIVGDCGQLAPASCYHSYVGAIYPRGGPYTAAVVPLFDPAGAFVGALAVAEPQSAVLAPAAQFTIVLLFVGLLVTVVVLAVGVWMCNLLTGEALDALHLRLNHLATVSAELERAARQQVAAARRQERMARQITEGARDIDALVNSMQQGHLSMHDSATGVWAEMSQPGVAPDPAAAMRFARQAVVMAARVGVAAEDARTRCNAVVRLMNQVIAEGHVLSGHGHETERRAAELCGVVEQVERVLGEPLTPGRSGSSSSSRLSALSSLPAFDRGAFDRGAFEREEPGPLARRWELLRLSAGLLGRRIARTALERAAELAGRPRATSHATGGPAPDDTTRGDGDDIANLRLPRFPAERAADTRPSLGVVRPDEWNPPLDGDQREPWRLSGLPELPDLPRHSDRQPDRQPDHPRWRGLDDAGRDRSENDTRPRG